MNIKPGDLFEWVSTYTNAPVQMGEELYSAIMEKYVPCDGICLCVGINNGVIHWVSDKGLFWARTNEVWRTRRPDDFNHPTGRAWVMQPSSRRFSTKNES